MNCTPCDHNSIFVYLGPFYSHNYGLAKNCVCVRARVCACVRACVCVWGVCGGVTVKHSALPRCRRCGTKKCNYYYYYYYNYYSYYCCYATSTTTITATITTTTIIATLGPCGIRQPAGVDSELHCEGQRSVRSTVPT